MKDEEAIADAQQRAGSLMGQVAIAYTPRPGLIYSPQIIIDKVENGFKVTVYGKPDGSKEYVAETKKHLLKVLAEVIPE